MFMMPMSLVFYTTLIQLSAIASSFMQHAISHGKPPINVEEPHTRDSLTYGAVLLVEDRQIQLQKKGKI